MITLVPCVSICPSARAIICMLWIQPVVPQDGSYYGRALTGYNNCRPKEVHAADDGRELLCKFVFLSYLIRMFRRSLHSYDSPVTAHKRKGVSEG